MMTNGYNQSDLSANLQKCQYYVKALEEERRKIQDFQRELPLCFELVTQAIETCKQQLSGKTNEYNFLHGHSESSEQTSSGMPVFEEFIPLKRASSDSDNEEQESKKLKNESSTTCNKNGEDCNDKNGNKSDWLRSVQLWNQTPDPPSKEDSPSKFAVLDLFKKEKINDVARSAPTQGGANGLAPPPSTSSTMESGGGPNQEEKEGQSQRKARRYWSPELHRRFVLALQQLGGLHVATPKQIRELMKVDGLTNDEVKSHLQKYRLHTRRSIPSNHNNNTQPPQFVVVRGIWMPPEYAAVATTTPSAKESGGADGKEIYAPITIPPPSFQKPPAPLYSVKLRQCSKPSSQSNDSSSYSKDVVQSCSPVSRPHILPPPHLLANFSCINTRE